VLIIFVREQRLNFTEIHTQLLHAIIFPMLRMNDEEHLLFDNDPHDFNALAEDCCDHQKFKYIKTEVARLLEALSDENK